jgi:hypothetical protein
MPGVRGLLSQCAQILLGFFNLGKRRFGLCGPVGEQQRCPEPRQVCPTGTLSSLIITIVQAEIPFEDLRKTISYLCYFCNDRNNKQRQRKELPMTPTLAILDPAGNPAAFATISTYLAYLGISIALTVWVARTLHKNGRIFLVDSFTGNEPLADSVNHLLVVGFYLVNIGFVSLALKYGDRATDAQTALEILSSKVGFVLVVLGAMHFFNLYVFARLRRRAVNHINQGAVPPVLPRTHMKPV